MAPPSGTPTMRDHRGSLLVALVSALSLQSSYGEGRDGAICWSGRARAGLHAGGDVGERAAAEGVAGRDERAGAGRCGSRDRRSRACVPGRACGERTTLAVCPRCWVDRGGVHEDGMTRPGFGGLTAMLICSAASASELPDVVPGSRVRVSSPALASGPAVGSLMRLEPGSILLDQGKGQPALRVPLDPHVRLELSLGRKSQAVRGAMIGAAVGVAPGLLLTFGDDNDGGDVPSPAVVAAMGAAGGALLGAAIGWAVKAEQWQEVGLPAAGVSFVPLRGGVAASIRVTWGARPTRRGSNPGHPTRRRR